MYMMLKDKRILYFDLDDMVVNVLDNTLLPFSIRDRIKSIEQTNDIQMAKIIANNIIILKTWMSNRVLSLSRDNAKKIFNLFNISQSNELETRVKICLLCKGISITDSYWIDTTENSKWENLNIRKNHFKEIVDIALEGSEPSITTSPICPELTTSGLFRKAWVRNTESNELYLLKSDRLSNNLNTRMEVLASKVLDCCTNINHVTYTGRVRKLSDNSTIYVDKCKNFVNEKYSFIEAHDIEIYCNTHNINFQSWALKNFGYKIANIVIADYIIANTDRHDANYGFLMDNDTGRIVDVAPIFDYNLSLVSDVFNKNINDTISQMFNTSDTVLGLTMKYLPYATLRLDIDKLKSIKSRFKDFKQVYNNILSRASQLNVVD